MGETMVRWFFGLLSFFLIFQTSTSGYLWKDSAGKDWSLKNQVVKTMPEFEEADTQIIVGIGRIAFLPCRVRNLNDKMVSWIRTRDLHILTSGIATFTADSRFESANTKGSVNWGLRLRNTQLSDSGTYECQVNTEPKMNRKVNLQVVTDERNADSILNDINLHMADQAGDEFGNGGQMTKILGAEEQFVKTGSTITFTCLVLTPNQTSSSVEWLKDGRQISFKKVLRPVSTLDNHLELEILEKFQSKALGTFLAGRGGMIVDTERAARRTTSRLTVSDVRQEDSGTYTCQPSNAKPHSIVLVVVEGEQTQAMKRNRSSSSSGSGSNRRRIFYSSGIPFPLALCFLFALCTFS